MSVATRVGLNFDELVEQVRAALPGTTQEAAQAEATRIVAGINPSLLTYAFVRTALAANMQPGDPGYAQLYSNMTNWTTPGDEALTSVLATVVATAALKPRLTVVKHTQKQRRYAA
jgi:hypothetical protein